MMKYPIERMLIKEFIVATIGRLVESRVGPTPLTPRDTSKPTKCRGAYTPRPPTPLAQSALAPQTLSQKLLPQLGPKQCQEAYAAGLRCEAPNAAKVAGRTWTGLGCAGLATAAPMTGIGTSCFGGSVAEGFGGAGAGGLAAGGPDLCAASHCVIPVGLSGSLMVTRRAFFTRSNNRAQTTCLCAALLKIPTHFLCSRMEANRHSPLPTSRKTVSFTPHTSITSCTNTRLN